jgi:hemolysin activation/secretion protein
MVPRDFLMYSNKAMSKSLLIRCSSTLVLLAIAATSAQAQQAPFLPNDAVPPGNRGPRPEPPTPQRQPLPNIPLPPTVPGNQTTSGTVNVAGYTVKGSTIFSAADFERVTRPFIGQGNTGQIEKARVAVENLYYDAGYRTTVAGIPPAQNLSQPGAIVTIEVQESTVSEVQIAGNKRVSDEYIRSRLRLSDKPLNYNELIQATSLLQRDPLFSNVSVEVRTGKKAGTNVLVVTVEEKKTRSVYLSTDNNRSANFGDWQRSIQLYEGNLTGGGDNLSLFYNNTSGSFGTGITYSTPINGENTKISLSATTFSSRQTFGAPVNLDFENNNQSYSVGIRHPLLRRTGNNFEEEIGVGFSVSKLNSSSFVNQQANGTFNTTTLNFTQDYSQIFGDSAISFNSNLRIGVDALGATTNSQGFLDGRFVVWNGSTYYSKNLGNNSQLFLTGGLQLADRPLIGSVLSSPFLYGYSPGIIANDNGAYATAGLSFPIVQQNNFSLSAIPSLNLATTWGSIVSVDPNTLASAGIGLQANFSNFNARLDWGVPLVYTNASTDNRLSFSVGYSQAF